MTTKLTLLLLLFAWLPPREHRRRARDAPRNYSRAAADVARQQRARNVFAPISGREFARARSR